VKGKPIMKSSKTQYVLYIFNMLITKGFIKKDAIIDALDISNLSFRRYMQELRAFYYNYMNKEDIIYDKTKNIYYLAK